VSLFRNKPLDFAPGEKASYSNSGYILLGYLIEKITTQDLLLWEQGLSGGKLLSAASMQKMITPFKKEFACGVFVSVENGKKMIEHRGGIVGFRTELRYFPDDKLTIAVLANIEKYPTEMALKLAAVAQGEKVILPSERQEIALPTSIIANYVGSYELEPGSMLEITLENRQLMLKAPNQPKFAIFPETESQFFGKDPEAQIEFFKNAKGEVSHLMIHQLGRDRKALKK
jgi:CubicO group peptidase (beta-lactamase class C family)